MPLLPIYLVRNNFHDVTVYRSTGCWSAPSYTVTAVIRRHVIIALVIALSNLGIYLHSATLCAKCNKYALNLSTYIHTISKIADFRLAIRVFWADSKIYPLQATIGGLHEFHKLLQILL